jgi:hypothetical protein
MSETPNNENEIVEPNAELQSEDQQVPEGAEELYAALTRIPQANEVILPVIMRKGDAIGVLGDAVFDSNTNKMVVSFNTPDGRDIAEFIGSGVLASISFSAQMARNEATNRLN